MSTPAAPAPEPAATPPSTAASGPRRSRRPERTGLSRSARWIAATAALLFGAAAVWLANQTPPNVTHKEAMAMALAIEQAKDLATLQRLVHFDTPVASVPMPQLNLDDAAWGLAEFVHANKRQGTYIFLGIQGDRTADVSLLFRANAGPVLGDYHELALARRDDAVAVVDLWSMRLGGSLRSLLAEQAGLAAPPEAARLEFAQAVAAKDGARIEAAYLALPAPFRSSRLVAQEYLRALDGADAGRFDTAVAEFRATHRGSFAPDVLLLARCLQNDVDGVSTPVGTLRDALAALKRIHGRVADDAFLVTVRDRLFQ